MMERCLRHGDRLLLSIRLESSHSSRRSRYFSIIRSSSSSQYSILGIDVLHSEDNDEEEDKDGGEERLSIGLSLPFDASSRVCLDGDGGFSIFRARGEHFIFKPVSVQGLWTVIQTLHMVSSSSSSSRSPPSSCIEDRSRGDYIVSSPQSCINEWHAMSDLLVKRPSTPDSIIDTQGEELEALIKSQLRKIMKAVDLDNITSKCIRNSLEDELRRDLCDYKPFIDKEILVILGQMDPASKIVDHVYLGSEWNASNLDELKANGITHILNVTREIDNFFPATFEYRNIRVFDEEATDLLKYFDETYRFVRKAQDAQGKVLIHCKMGISRSATLTMAYLMKDYEMSLTEVMILVGERRAIINPNEGFIKQLVTYEGILGANSNRHNGLFRSKSESNIKCDAGKKRSEPSKKQRNSWNHERRSSKKVKALTKAFNTTELLCRPKSWSEHHNKTESSSNKQSSSHLMHINEEAICPCYKDLQIVDSSTSSGCPNQNEGEKSSKPCSCPLEVELQVPPEGNNDSVVQSLSDLPIRLRQELEPGSGQGLGSLHSEGSKGSPNSREYTQNQELLSVKTIANMFDIKPSPRGSSSN